MATGNGHPAWESILSKIPEALHDVVKPVLLEWDQGVQQALEAKTQELKKLEGFKQFADNGIDPDWLVEAADFAYRFERDPKDVMTQANEAFGLGFTTGPVPQQQQSNDSFEDDEEVNGDISRNPAYAQIMEQLTALQEQVGGFTSAQENDRQAKEFNEFLGQMHEQHGAFDDNYITALMANNQSFPQALEAYQTLMAGAVQKEQEQPGSEQQGSDNAAVVLGGDSSGGGMPKQPISFGNMKTGDLEDLVASMIEAGDSES